MNITGYFSKICVQTKRSFLPSWRHQASLGPVRRFGGKTIFPPKRRVISGLMADSDALTRLFHTIKVIQLIGFIIIIISIKQ